MADGKSTITKEQNHVTYVYYALIASLIMGFIPSFIFTLIATCIFTVVFIAAYRMRKKADNDSLTKSHMGFIIRTIWTASFILIPSMIISGVYLSANIDHASLYPCLDNMLTNGNTNNVTAMRLFDLMRPCLNDFVSTNKLPIIISTIMAMGPVIAYFIYRITKGLSAAGKGYLINKS